MKMTAGKMYLGCLKLTLIMFSVVIDEFYNVLQPLVLPDNPQGVTVRFPRHGYQGVKFPSDGPSAVRQLLYRGTVQAFVRLYGAEALEQGFHIGNDADAVVRCPSRPACYCS